MSEQTVVHELSFLRRMFNVAIRDGLAETNPVKGLVTAPRNQRARYLDHETLQTIAELLGHSSVQMAQRYAHLSPGHLQAAVQRLVSKPTGTRTGTKSTRREKS